MPTTHPLSGILSAQGTNLSMETDTFQPVGAPIDYESDDNKGYVPYEPKYTPTCLDEVEDLENYEPGGLPPIDLGGSLCGGRYVVLQKLGYGGSSTVWLARDQDADPGLLVTLKAMRSDRSGVNTPDLAILQYLKSLYPLSDHFQTILHHFYEHSPNGNHLVIICPLAGPSVASLYSHSMNKTTWMVGSRRFRADLARSTARDTANGLYQMHSAGIVHGDLTPSNILVKTAPDVAKWSDTDVFSRFGQPQKGQVKMITGMQRLPRGGRLFTSSDDASHGPHAPPFVYESILMSNTTEAPLLQESTFINDFGQSYRVASPPADYLPGTISGYMSPEMFFEGRAGLESDVWSLACLIYELRTGLRLFDITWSINKDDLVVQQAEILGRLPDRWLKALHPEDREQWFTNDGELLKAYRNQSIQDKLRLAGTYDASDADKGPMYEKPNVAIEEDEVEALADLLGKMLKYQPEERITMAQVIEHPWFAGTNTFSTSRPHI